MPDQNQVSNSENNANAPKTWVQELMIEYAKKCPNGSMSEFNALVAGSDTLEEARELLAERVSRDEDEDVQRISAAHARAHGQTV